MLLIGFVLGFILAAQVGPVTLLIVRSVLRGGHAVAVGVAMAGAVASIDVLYAALGLAGAGRLFDTAEAGIALGLVSAAILIGIGARTLWRGLRARHGAEADDEVASPTQAFGTALAATALNPLTFALWTISFPATAPDAAGSSPGHALTVLCGVALGTLAWYGGFALLVALARSRIGPRVIAAIDIAVGAALLVFGALLGYRTVAHQTEAAARWSPAWPAQ
jgi:putative LysE/RhtB family amino acid efflux pump